MTQQVRRTYRNHRRGAWAAVLVVLVAAALVVVLPGLASDTTSSGGIKPKSTYQQVAPSLVDVGGSNFSCDSAGTTYGSPAIPSGLTQFQISKPTPGSYEDSATGVTFDISAPTAGNDGKSYFSFSVSGAVVYHVGVNGGTKTAWYDYNKYGSQPAYPMFPNGGVSSDTDLHSTPDSKYKFPASPTFYVASITTFCYKPLTVQPRCDEPFDGLKFGGTAGAVDYSAQLVENELGCKGDDVVMYSYTSGSGSFFATLNPVTGGGPQYEVVEHIQWTGISGDVQNPITLRYDDIAPYDGVDTAGIAGNDGWREMKMCGSDPRPDATSDPFNLGGAIPDMPPSDADGAHTSCLLTSTFSAGTGTGDRHYDAWVFSKVDGARGNFLG